MSLTVPRYTVADLAQFPDDGPRYELLDGLLLVTSAPSTDHQALSARLTTMLYSALINEQYTRVFAPGGIIVPPTVHLKPDLLVVPASVPATAAWEDITEHWLAVEIVSRSSRMYDREFKRDAYLALGVGEVWLVDMLDKSVEVCHTPGAGEVMREAIEWHVPALRIHTAVDLTRLFEEVP